MSLCVAMLLVGGGFGPPIIGILASVAGLGINGSYPRWRRWVPANAGSLLARLWPWIFGLSVANGVFLVIGSAILVYLLGVNNSDLFVGSFFLAVLSLPVTILAGVAHDTQIRE